MEHDNAANQANFDEISAHISMAQAKLKTATGEQRELLLDALRKQGVRLRRLNGWRALNG